MRKQYFPLLVALGFFFLATFTDTQSLYAQTQNHEIGVRLYSLSDFGFLYKKELKNSHLRLRAGSLNTDIEISDRKSDNVKSDELDFRIGLYTAIGWEKRLQMSEKFSFIHGFEPRISLSYSSDKYTQELEFGDDHEDRSTFLSIRPSIGYIIGFQYSLKRLNIGLEFIPDIGLNYQYSKDNRGADENPTTSNSYGFDSSIGINNLALTLTYKFQVDKGDKEME